MNYTAEELRALGIRFGDNVAIHKTVQFFKPESIQLGSHVRIDCFCVLSAGASLIIGNHVHVSAGVMVFGREGVEIRDFAALSSRVTIYTVSDDYVEGYMANPTIPEKFRKVHRGPVIVGAHVIVGCGSVILPGVTLATGVAVGALSLVKKDVAEFSIVAGNPMRIVGRRDGERLLRLAADFIKENQDRGETGSGSVASGP